MAKRRSFAFALNFFVSFFFQEKKEKDKTATGLKTGKTIMLAMRISHIMYRDVAKFFTYLTAANGLILTAIS